MALTIDDDALNQIVQLSGGDARTALNLLEFCAESISQSGQKNIDIALVNDAAQRKTLLYDKAGEEHFNLISALHKSLRSSDVDASLYWLTRMLSGGEDPLYIVRRVIRFASEDIGLADPRALQIALNAATPTIFSVLPRVNWQLPRLLSIWHLRLNPTPSTVLMAMFKRRWLKSRLTLCRCYP